MACDVDLPSSAKFPNATRHISVRAALWQWIPSNFTKVGITPILISWAWRESVKTEKEKGKKCLYYQILSNRKHPLLSITQFSLNYSKGKWSPLVLFWLWA